MHLYRRDPLITRFMNMDSDIETIRAFVKEILTENGAHGLDHTLRVTRLSEIIGIQEGADMRVLIPAALLHDIARPLEEKTGKPHEIEGARIAKEFLLPMGFPKDLIEPVIDAIRTHRFRSENKPATLEAQILSDADKLDAMGAIGIARTFLTAGERGGDIVDAMDHIKEKLLNLQVLMYTKTAQKMAGSRHIILQTFLTTLCEEMQTE